MKYYRLVKKQNWWEIQIKKWYGWRNCQVSPAGVKQRYYQQERALRAFEEFIKKKREALEHEDKVEAIAKV
jgi:hypothetical protein